MPNYDNSDKIIHAENTNRRNGPVSSEYEAWVGMKQRCYNSNRKEYQNYGGRGIKVCDRWLNDYEAFLADMGEKPTPKHTLGRVNNDGDYDPLNCRWETRKRQNNNKRNNVQLTLREQREIRMLRRSGYSWQMLADEFMVSRGTCWNIVYRIGRFSVEREDT